MSADDQPITEELCHKTLMRGVGLTADEDFDQAVPILQSALAMAIRLNLDYLISNCRVTLSSAYKFSGQYTKAEEILVSTMEAAEESDGPDSIGYAASVFALADIYMDQEKLDEARILLDSASGIIRHIGLSLQPDFLEILFAICKYYCQLDELGKADELSRYAYDLTKTLVGTNDAAILKALLLCAISADALHNVERVRYLHSQIEKKLRQWERRGATDMLGIGPELVDFVNDSGVVSVGPIDFY